MPTVPTEHVYNRGPDEALDPLFAKLSNLGIGPLGLGSASVQVDVPTDSIESVSRRANEIPLGWDIVRSRVSNAGSDKNGGTNRRLG